MTKKVFWDAGHGGKDPGAVKYVKESDVTIKVVNYAHEYLKENYNCESKKDITADSINTVVGRANAWGADLFVSVHFNAGGGDGYEALVYSASNKALGQCFEKYVKAVGQNSRGVKYRPDLGVLRLTKMDAILNEIAFVDNKKDIKDWDENSELKTMGVALAKATADYLNITKKKKSSAPVSGGTSFKVKVTVDALNIRTGAGTRYEKVGTIRDKGIYTIVEKKSNWGKLKSGKGWICLDYTKRV